MLFTSAQFILIFLPVTLFGFFLTARVAGAKAAALWLAFMSVFFYGYWAPRFTVLLLGSIVTNFFLGKAIGDVRGRSLAQAKQILIIAVIGNLALLGYYKYLNFFANSINLAFGGNLPFIDVVLPIGISFFTFTQIAYLVDTYEGKVREADPIHYLLFVTYFPHLIAGPVLHHSDMMPQFGDQRNYHPRINCFLIGAAFIVAGLFKKIVLADSIQPYAAAVFDAPSHFEPTLVEAWGGALAYTFQLYFDFSGYSDMAVGLSWLFGIKLPFNFNSPYRAVSIIDFWRRWHMTLSRFLRDYLYIPLGGNRDGVFRRYLNLLATMFLGGLWHGAGWTFAIWGLLHGGYLMINHGWKSLVGDVDVSLKGSGRLVGYRFFAQGLTFLAVVFAWVFFRAKNMESASNITAGMFGAHGLGAPVGWWSCTSDVMAAGCAGMPLFSGATQISWIVALALLAFLAPNSQRVILDLVPRISVRTSVLMHGSLRYLFVGAACASALLLLIVNSSRTVSEFIYFNF